MQIIKRILLLILLFFSASYAIFSLEIDTTKIYREAEPGEVIEGVINIINSHPKDTLSIDSNIEDLVYDSQGQQATFKPYGTQDNSCARWIKINPVNPKIQPHSSQALTYIITLPKELKHAQYFAVLFLMTGSSVKKVTDQAIMIGSQARMGIIIKITIPSLAKSSGSITDFQIIPANENAPMKLQYTFQNTGNTLQKVFGTFSIIDQDGNLFGRGNLKTALANHSDTVTIESVWDGDLNVGTYDMITEFKYDPKIIEIKEVKFENQYQE